MQAIDTNAVRILVAKHIPDLRRMEPHNIGVVVWTNHGIAAKFVGDDDDKSSGIPSSSSMKDWISYWKQFISRDEARDNSGKTVRSTDPAFYELLKSKSKAQYALVDAGNLLDSVDTPELKAVADALFVDLVAVAPRKASSAPKMAEKQMIENAREAVKNSKVCRIEGFRERYDWVCSNQDRREYFHFDYGVHDHGPQLVMQRVSWKPDKIYSTAYQFQSMTSAYKHLTRDKCISLVYASDDDRLDDRIDSAWNVLNSRGTIVNVFDIEKAIERLNRLAS